LFDENNNPMSPLALALLLAAGLALAGAVARQGRRAFVEVAPGWRRFLREQGLSEPCQFLDLRALIVSGHPDRHVARVRLGSGQGAVMAYLKREHGVRLTSRLANALAGFGLVSRSLREAHTLQALSRENLGGPEWLAAGEDGRGRAFLLVREVEDSVDLRTYLRDETDPARRIGVARALGAQLARLHDAGFEHPDLYAKHVLVQAGAATFRLLDWQRARRCRALGWRARGRSLAALDATLDPRLAAGCERRAFLRAYLAAAQQHPEEAVTPGRPLPPAAPRRVARMRLVLQGLRARLRRLLKRRHVREKRQLPGPVQAWTCLDGEALCVTPALQERCPAGVPEWLPLDAQPQPADGSVSRRWLTVPGGGSTLLTRRRQRCRPAGSGGRGTPSPEQRHAALLLRLERHGVVAPRVLALGERRDGTAFDSFLLTEPPAGATALEVWLRRRSDLRMRRSMLRQAGAVLSRLHEAACYLDGGSRGCGLAVSAGHDCDPHIVLEDAGSVTSRRRRSAGREWRDLAWMQRLLGEAGCGRTDLRRFWAGYRTAAFPGADGPRTARMPTVPLSPADSARQVQRPAVCILPGRETVWHRLLSGVRRLRQRADWQVFAGDSWSDRIMGIAVTDRFHAKQGRTTGRLVLAAPRGTPGRSLTVYLKRHYRLPWWQGVLAVLSPRAGWSPALQEWRHLQWARRQGVPVPEVVAAAEYIGPWGRLQSFLAVEELAGMVALHEAVGLARTRLDGPTFRRWKRTLAEEMARLGRMLHDRRVFHKDFYFCHFYVAAADTLALPADGWEGRLYLIDLHRLAHHPWTWRLWQLKDLAQLLYSSEIPGIDTRDRLWFWHAYRGSGPRRGTDRWLRRWVWFKWQSYRRHNARKTIPP
jgi:heptose I phosphotransferase